MFQARLVPAKKLCQWSASDDHDRKAWDCINSSASLYHGHAKHKEYLLLVVLTETKEY